MLIEAFLSLTAESTPALRRLGLVRDAVGLWSRANRRRTAWRPHEERCRAFVAGAVGGLPRGGRALVLGSGLLCDLPLDLLADRFDRLVLVDAVHLWPARRLADRVGAERRVLDLSGVAGRLEEDPGTRRDPLEAVRREGRVDFVLSANLLSQMPRAAERLLERGRAASGVAADLPARIVAWHLADLAAFDCPVCLVTDTAVTSVSREGELEEHLDLTRGVALPTSDASWDWEVAPFGEIERGFAYLHRVQAWRDIGPALRLKQPG